MTGTKIELVKKYVCIREWNLSLKLAQLLKEENATKKIGANPKN